MIRRGQVKWVDITLYGLEGPLTGIKWNDPNLKAEHAFSRETSEFLSLPLTQSMWRERGGGQYQLRIGPYGAEANRGYVYWRVCYEQQGFAKCDYASERLLDAAAPATPALLGLLNKTCEHYQITRAQNDMGAVTEQLTYVQSFPCRLTTKAGVERMVAGQTGVVVTHRLYCLPQTTAIDEGDELRIDGKVFNVVVVNDVDRMSHHLEIDLIETRPDRHGR